VETLAVALVTCGVGKKMVWARHQPNNRVERFTNYEWEHRTERQRCSLNSAEDDNCPGRRM